MDYGFVLRNYFRYRLNAKDEYSIHSPFMFDLFTKGLQKNSDRSNYKGLDVLVKEVAKPCLHNNLRTYRRRALFLCRFLDYFKPKTMLIAGNEGGVCAAYFAKTLQESRIFNVLYDNEVCRNLEAAFVRKGIGNISFVCANSDKGLSNALEEIGQVDFVLLNKDCESGNLREEMEEIMPFCSEECIMVLNEIHYDRDMNELWKRLNRDERFRVCADFFLCGAAFLTKKPLKKQCYVLKRK